LKLKQITDTKRASLVLFITSWIIYAVVSMTKTAYSASIASIVAEGLFDKSQAGVINASFFFFYGTAQLVGAKLVDKIKPSRLVNMTLIGTAIASLGMAFSKSFVMLLVFWSFSGLIQFAIWPAILRIITEFLHPDHTFSAMSAISFCYCGGMLLNYLFASVVLAISRWQMLFILSAVILAVTFVFWRVVVAKTKDACVTLHYEYQKHLYDDKRETPTAQKSHSFSKVLVSSGLLLLLIPSFIRTSLDVGVKAWVPTMITESYAGISPSFASVLTTVIVFVNLGGIFIAGILYPRVTKNSFFASGLCFLIAVPFTVALLFIGKIPVAPVVIFLAIITTMMYAAHQLIDVVIPAHFAKYGYSGSVASIVNAIASYGAVVANILFGVVAQNFGWSVTIVFWIAFAVIAFVLCAVASPMWKRFSKE